VLLPNVLTVSRSADRLDTFSSSLLRHIHHLSAYTPPPAANSAHLLLPYALPSFHRSLIGFFQSVNVPSFFVISLSDRSLAIVGTVFLYLSSQPLLPRLYKRTQLGEVIRIKRLGLASAVFPPRATASSRPDLPTSALCLSNQSQSALSHRPAAPPSTDYRLPKQHPSSLASLLPLPLGLFLLQA
jgi:hypothetical protein